MLSNLPCRVTPIKLQMAPVNPDIHLSPQRLNVEPWQNTKATSRKIPTSRERESERERERERERQKGKGKEKEKKKEKEKETEKKKEKERKKERSKETKK